MAEELEIKLSLAPGALNQARQWLLSQSGVRARGEKNLINRYYDTPDGDLNRRKVALRVRQAGSQYIQTLKTQGEFVDGAHRREEWEWPLTGTSLNIGLLADTPVGEGVKLAQLAPVFETNFTRQALMLESSQATVECALDQGRISAAGRTRNLCELELERKEGDPEALLGWAQELAVQVPVFLNLISKAEQGYAVAGMHQPTPLADSEPLVNRVLHGLARAWLAGVGDRQLEADLRAMAAHKDLPAAMVRDVQWLLDSLQAGQPVAELAARSSRLGQVQLSLLSWAG